MDKYLLKAKSLTLFDGAGFKLLKNILRREIIGIITFH
jgi:hypothetical protein